MSLLPTTKTVPQFLLSALTIFMYGGVKLGKSSFWAQAPDAIFLATEPGLKGLSVFKVDINDWPTFLKVVAEILTGRHPFRTVVIDIIDNLYRMCADHVCGRLQVEHEGDLEFGKGFEAVSREFNRALNALALSQYGLVMIGHADEKEVKRKGEKQQVAVPRLPKGARKVVLGLADLVLFVEVKREEQGGNVTHRHVIRTKPRQRYEAGDRTGRLPETIDLNYAAFVKAFEAGANGQQSSATTATTTTAGQNGANGKAPNVARAQKGLAKLILLRQYEHLTPAELESLETLEKAGDRIAIKDVAALWKQVGQRLPMLDEIVIALEAGPPPTDEEADPWGDDGAEAAPDKAAANGHANGNGSTNGHASEDLPALRAKAALLELQSKVSGLFNTLALSDRDSAMAAILNEGLTAHEEIGKCADMALLVRLVAELEKAQSKRAEA